jgi:hypothetical protein
MSFKKNFNSRFNQKTGMKTELMDFQKGEIQNLTQRRHHEPRMPKAKCSLSEEDWGAISRSLAAEPSYAAIARSIGRAVWGGDGVRGYTCGQHAQ